MRKRSPHPGKPLRALLIEDSDDDALLVMRELRRGGYEPVCERVSTSEGMERALEEASARGEPWEVVISDYFMPRFSALDALALLRDSGYDTPFIVVSGKIGEDAAVGMVRAGAQDYVPKDNMARLCPAIERELRDVALRRERQRAREELARSEERFRRLMEQAADAVLVHDLDGNFVDVNQWACESLGYTREELLGMSVPDVEMNYTPGSLARIWEGIVASGPRTVEGIHRRKDGTTFPVEVRVGVFESEGRQLILALARDITERKRFEEALRQSEQLYRSVVERVAENIFLVDVETRRIVRTNQALQKLLGYTAAEFDELTLYDVIAHDRENVDQNIRRILQEGRQFLGERRYRRKDGSTVDVEVSVSVISYGGGEAMCIVAHDLTERKRAEEALDRIREAERNRIARDLHDDILQDIVYALQEIQVVQIVAENGMDPALDDAARALRRSVEGLRAAIFELHPAEAAQRSFISSVESLLDLNRRMARKRYELELIVEKDFPQTLSGRAGRDLIRILQEALANVRRHAEARHVRVRLGLDGGLAYAEVADDGRGFDAGRLQPGVGTYSMRQRASELGGELRIESKPGEGTRVRFQAPRHRLIDGRPPDTPSPNGV